MTERLKGFVPLFLIGLALAVLVMACGALKKAAPEKNYFALEVGRVTDSQGKNSGPILRVSQFKVSPVYDEKSLVYRDADLKFQADFYNEFIVAPGPLVTSQVARWLTGANLFRQVQESSSQVLPDYILEGNVSALYGDYRDSTSPKAVIELQFFLIQAAKPKADVVLQRQYRREIPLSGSSAAELVRGFNEGLRQILVEFEKAVALAGLPNQDQSR